MPTRRRFLRTLAAATLAPTVARAAETATLDILVDKDKAWGTSQMEDIRALTFAAGQELWRHCRGNLLRPIRVYCRPDFPFTDLMHDWRGRIRVGLACVDRNWAQMAFQFGHEFCHVLAQHSAIARKSWRPPRHANLWFEECLCECASLYVLRRLGASPPRDLPAATPGYTTFATDRLARPDHQLPAGVSFAQWFRENESDLRANHALRARNVIVARQMLPLFEAEPGAWECAAYLNLGKRQHDKPLAQHLTEWQAASPPAQRAFLGRLAALFGAA